MTTTFVCPNCGMMASVEGKGTGCEECHDTAHTLYTLRAGDKTVTLCLTCIQKQMWRTVPPVFTVGPTEVKSG